MYILIAGGGKVGRTLAHELLAMRHEVTVIEQRADRYRLLEEELEHVAQHGDATELLVLERCGIERAELVVAVTGDDEDNIVVCQVARERYGVERIIARVNDPRNHDLFDLLGIAPSVCATTSIMRLIEHELPDHEFGRCSSCGARASRSSRCSSATTWPSAASPRSRSRRVRA